MKGRSLERYAAIRHAHFTEGLSIRSCAEKFGVHRRNVREAIENVVPASRKPAQRKSPALDTCKNTILSWLEVDKSMPKKQRHTAKRVWSRLVDECGADISYSTVRRYVAQIKSEAEVPLIEVMVPQHHDLGFEAEVDFGDIHFFLNGQKVVAHMFVMRLSASGKGFHRVYPTEAQEAFLEGHKQAFEYFSGVPKRVRYDNLTPAVIKVLEGRNRIQTERFLALKSHYKFESFFCEPGIDGAHEKGGVEGEVGRFRRNQLVPVPRVGAFRELNELCSTGDQKDDLRHINYRPQSVKDHFELEVPFLTKLPLESFDPCLHLICRVDKKSRVCVRQNYYSVPVRYVGKKINVTLSASEVKAIDALEVVARHERQIGIKNESLFLDHYLEVFKVKPGAFIGAEALNQERLRKQFSVNYDKFFARARRTLGDKAATKAVVEILLQQRSLGEKAIREGIIKALKLRVFDPNVVIFEARRYLEPQNTVAIDGFDSFDRKLPEISQYDELLELSK